MRFVSGHARAAAAFVVLLTALPPSAFAFPTGAPEALTVAPATIRQREGAAATKVEATVVLTDPSPAFFICQIRSQAGDKIAFPAIIFRKGDREGKSEGFVYWKMVSRDVRVRLEAFNADVPDRQISFIVALKPTPLPDTPGD